MHQVIIYIRVFNEEQEYQQQLEELRAIAQRQREQIIIEIIDRISINQINQKQEGIQQLIRLCRQNAIQRVLVSEFSHLGSSRAKVAKIVEDLTQLRTSIYMHNIGAETLVFAGRPIPVIHNLFKLSRSERKKRRDSILAGLEKARLQGKNIGRPTGSIEDQAVFLKKYAAVARQLQQGLSLRKTAKLFNVAVNTVRKVKTML